MSEENTGEILYCVGCGRAVCKVHPGQTLATACNCGAGAPILHLVGATVFVDAKGVLDLRQWYTPTSLLRRSADGGEMPHLEYYLGFSSHESDLKTQVTRALRALGSISYTECSEASCRASFQRSKENWQGKNRV